MFNRLRNQNPEQHAFLKCSEPHFDLRLIDIQKLESNGCRNRLYRSLPWRPLESMSIV